MPQDALTGVKLHAVTSLTLDSVFILQLRALILQSKFTVALFSFSLFIDLKISGRDPYQYLTGFSHLPAWLWILSLSRKDLKGGCKQIKNNNYVNKKILHWKSWRSGSPELVARPNVSNRTKKCLQNTGIPHFIMLHFIAFSRYCVFYKLKFCDNEASLLAPRF